MAAPPQYITADDDLDEDALPSFTHPALAPSPTADKGKGRASPLPTSPAPGGSAANGSGPSRGLSGAIGSGPGGSSPAAPKQNARQTVGGVRVETRSTGVDTLDEPVTTTIARDLVSIYRKLVQVLYPLKSTDGRAVLADWDLWGPLVLCLLLGVMLSVNAPPSQALGVFTGVVVIISLGSVVVTVQTKLLGGRVSFFQGLCVLGYCVAPLDLAAIIGVFVRMMWVRLPVSIAAWAWCVWASVRFLDGTKIERQRILLAVYPLVLFYFILAWMIIIQ